MFASVTLVTIALASSALAQLYRPPVPTLARSEIRDNHGQVSLSYSTGDGTAITKHDILEIAPHGDYVPRQSGSVSYTSPEGIPVAFNYIADQDGFRYEGTHVPRGPQPIPIL